MDCELAVSPSGQVRIRPAEGQDADGADSAARRLIEAFSAGQAEGLFALAAGRLEASLPPPLAFWRDFAGRYLTELCHTPQGADGAIEAIAPPSPAELATLLLSAPPMRGGEYLAAEVFERAWRELDAWVRGEASSFDGGLSGFLMRRAPLWHQVGRVCFHLAENRRDPDYPFAFMATYAPRLSRGTRVQYQPLSGALREYAGGRNKQALVKLLSPVHLASQRSGLIKELVDSGDIFHPLAWSPGEAYQFLKDVPLLEESGVLVRLPDWWRKRPRPRAGITIGRKGQSKFGAEAMLDFHVELALGDEKLTEEEWRELMAAGEGLVLLRGQWVEVDPQKLAEALSHWQAVERAAGDGGISFIEGMRLLAGAPADLDAASDLSAENSQWSFARAGEWLKELLAELRDPANVRRAQPGKALKATLRPYQDVGVNWLYLMNGLGLGACLADDMGLGKTIQVLSLLLALKGPQGKPSLLVLPASLLANWKSEMAKFAPSLSARFVHPSETAREDLAALADDPSKTLRGVDAVLTTYGMLLRQEWLLEVDWRLVVLDEAQAIKNPSSRQTRRVKRLKSDARIALTGTPIENRLSDLWSLFDFLCPGLLGSAAKFKAFAKALDERETNRYAPLRNLVSPYILRRLKTDKNVIADLPDKTEVSAFCGLTRRQAALYEKFVKEMALDMKGLGGMKRRGLVLSYILRFKQICNHPSQLLGDGGYAPADSGKFDRLGEICHEVAARQEKALVFTQFREMTEPICGFLSEVFARAGLILHGGTTVRKRKGIVDAFQREDGPPFFVLSLKAGGTGLNLTAASHVIHFDRWWNPAVENQATDRAFRIGQRRNVLVHKFVCRGTIEEKIDALIADKMQLAEDILAGGAEKMLTEMSDAELLNLVALDVDKALV